MSSKYNCVSFIIIYEIFLSLLPGFLLIGYYENNLEQQDIENHIYLLVIYLGLDSYKNYILTTIKNLIFTILSIFLFAKLQY